MKRIAEIKKLLADYRNGLIKYNRKTVNQLQTELQKLQFKYATTPR